MSPPKLDFGGDVLPAPLVGGAKDSYIPSDSIGFAEATENGLPSRLLQYLVSGGTGLDVQTPDTRITNVNALPGGPVSAHQRQALHLQLLRGEPRTPLLPDVAAAGLQRAHTSPRTMPPDATPSCSPGWKSPSAPAPTACTQPGQFRHQLLPGAATTGEGSTALGFYNVQQGDAALLQVPRRHLRDERQLPPVRARRHRRQPHHARPRRCHLVQRRQTASRRRRRTT